MVGFDSVRGVISEIMIGFKVSSNFFNSWIKDVNSFCCFSDSLFGLDGYFCFLIFACNDIEEAVSMIFLVSVKGILFFLTYLIFDMSFSILQVSQSLESALWLCLQLKHCFIWAWGLCGVYITLPTYWLPSHWSLWWLYLWQLKHLSGFGMYASTLETV